MSNLNNLIKCPLCSHIEDFSVKNFIIHIDKIHNHLSQEKQKLAIKKMSDKIRVKNLTIENEDVKNYLDPILAFVREYLTNYETKQLYQENTVEHANYRLVNYLSKEAKILLNDNEINIYENKHFNSQITETSKYNTFPRFYPARM